MRKKELQSLSLDSFISIKKVSIDEVDNLILVSQGISTKNPNCHLTCHVSAWRLCMELSGQRGFKTDKQDLIGGD